MKIMESKTNIYLKTTHLQFLENWSVQYLLETKFSYNEELPLIAIGSFLSKSKNKVLIEDKERYQRVTVKINNGGIIQRDTETGINIGTKQQYKISSGQFLMSKIDARNGAFGLVPDSLEGAIVTNDFPVFDVDRTIINPEFLVLITTTKEFIRFAQSCSSGTTNRQRIDINLFLNVKIPLPPLSEQNKIAEAYNKKIQLAEKQKKEAQELEKQVKKYFYKELDVEKDLPAKSKQMFRTILFSNLFRWDFKEASSLTSKYPIKKISDIIQYISTGTTPPTNRKEFYESGKVNFYTPADLGSDIYLNNAERKITELAIGEKKARRFEKETLLFVGIGSTIGKVGIVNNEYATSNQQITGMVINPKIADIKFVCYFFNYFKHITIKEKTQATIPIVNQNKILNIPIPIPDIRTQKKIVKEIDQKNKEIHELRNNSRLNREQAIHEFENKIFKK